MAKYGGPRDIFFKKTVAKSFMRGTASQEVIYYKFSLENTAYDIYGDAITKMYRNPVMLICIVDRNPQIADDDDYGTSTSRLNNFAFLKDDLRDLGIVPEKGDIIVWDESYYEVDLVVEDQLLLGKDPNYSLDSNLDKFGTSLSIICETHLTRVNRLNIIQTR